jgi:hypothetical protein
VRKFILVVAVLALLVVAAVVYLKATTPTTSDGVRFPLSPHQRALLASVPESAEAFALIPAAAVVQSKLLANPVTRDAAAEFIEHEHLPRPWMLGNADLVIWRDRKQTGFSVHLDPIRQLFVRNIPADFSFHALGEQRLAKLLELTEGFEPADAIVIQQGHDNTYPPIERPAVTTVKVTGDEVILRSGGQAPPPVREGDQDRRGRLSSTRFPRGALLAATFQDPPRAVGDLDRLLGTNISTLLQDGGSIILYDVETGTLLPRPKGLIAVPATPEKRAAAGRIARVAEVIGEVRESGDRILISFDRTSLGSFMSEQFVDPTWPEGDWSARVDPKRLVPILEDLGDSTGLRLATPRLHRSIRDFRRWMRHLSHASSIEASHTETPEREELRVRISAK